jgi:phospholipid transport system transporter-binding protein
VSEVSIRPAGADRFVVAGPLQFDTVRRARKAGIELFDGRQAVTLDLQGVTRSNSAGLALLIEWMRAARQRGVQVRFENVPAQLRAIARASRLEHILH